MNNQLMERAAPAQTERAPSPLKKGLLWGGFGLLALAIVAAAGFLTYAMAFYENVYPNVYVDGVSVGGLTEAQAEQRLNGELANVYAGKAVDLSVDERSVQITSEAIGASLAVTDTARRAYGVGREGGFFARLAELSRAAFGRVDLTAESAFYIDRVALAEEIRQLAALVDQQPTEYAVELHTGGYTVQNALIGRMVPQEALCEYLARRFEDRDFSPARYETEKVLPRPLDLDSLYSQIYVEPQDARLDTTDAKNIVIQPEVIGVSFDKQAAAAALEAAGQTQPAAIEIPFIYTRPAVNMQQLSAALFRDELGTFSTNLSSSNVPRTSNIRLAASLMDGTILLPGDVFSYNGVVGQRTPERGFQEAGAYVNGKLVPETGGGICQLSTTLYMAALHANLKIVERLNHSMTVGYVKTGFDATVNWGTTDFKFENDTAYPIRVSAVQEGNSVSVTLVGTMEKPFTVEILREQLEYRPHQTKTVVNNALLPGQSVVVSDGHDGWTVQTYRVVRDADGNEVSRAKEALSTYRRVDKVTEVGPAAVSNPTDTPAVPASGPETPAYEGPALPDPLAPVYPEPTAPAFPDPAEPEAPALPDPVFPEFPAFPTAPEGV